MSDDLKLIQGIKDLLRCLLDFCAFISDINLLCFEESYFLFVVYLAIQHLLSASQ